MQLCLVHGVQAPNLQPMAGSPKHALERGRRGVRARALEPCDLGLTQTRTVAELRLRETGPSAGGAEERRGGHAWNIASVLYAINVMLWP